MREFRDRLSRRRTLLHTQLWINSGTSLRPGRTERLWGRRRDHFRRDASQACEQQMPVGGQAGECGTHVRLQRKGGWLLLQGLSRQIQERTGQIFRQSETVMLDANPGRPSDKIHGSAFGSNETLLGLR